MCWAVPDNFWEESSFWSRRQRWSGSTTTIKAKISIELGVLFQRSNFKFFLDCHHVWRSLDPTLNIWSNFAKNKKIFLSPFFFRVFKKDWTFLFVSFFFLLKRNNFFHLHPVICLVISPLIHLIIHLSTYSSGYLVLQSSFIKLFDGGLQCEFIWTFYL